MGRSVKSLILLAWFVLKLFALIVKYLILLRSAVLAIKKINTGATRSGGNPGVPSRPATDLTKEEKVRSTHSPVDSGYGDGVNVPSAREVAIGVLSAPLGSGPGPSSGPLSPHRAAQLAILDEDIVHSPDAYKQRLLAELYHLQTRIVPSARDTMENERNSYTVKHYTDLTSQAQSLIKQLESLSDPNQLSEDIIDRVIRVLIQDITGTLINSFRTLTSSGVDPQIIDTLVEEIGQDLIAHQSISERRVKAVIMGNKK